MVRTSIQIHCIWWIESSFNHVYPIVNILCSAPAMNTHSRKRNIVIQDPIEHLDNYALNIQYFFALPNTMDNHNIVQVIQSDTTSYNLQDLDEEDIAEWNRVKVKNVRVKRMRKIREKAGVLKKLKRELRQVHKLSWTESGFPGICWWHLKYWDKDLGLKVKKEEPSTPTLDNIKVKSPPTLNLQYPLQSPTTPSSRYRSLDPNDFKNWGDLATA